MLWVKLLVRKSDVFAAFQRFRTAVEKESGRQMQDLRSDNAGKYTSHKFRHYLVAHEISHKLPPPHSPQANGAAERVNRTIVEGRLSLLEQANGSPLRRSSSTPLSFSACRLPLPPVAFRSASGKASLFTFECSL